MKYLTYKNIDDKNTAHIENVSIIDIAKEVGTPFYAYSKQSLIENFLEYKDNFQDIDCKICYAIKANSNISLVKILAENGSGIDAVSAGEVFRAIKAGINPKDIVFAGVGKTKEEIKYALENGVEHFSAESKSEIFALNEVANNLGKVIKFSLRVNPDVDAKTHEKISTGRKGDKFGVDIDEAQDIYNIAKNLPALEIYGISTHIGSQITKIEPFELAFKKIRQLCLDLKKSGHNIRSIDLGGGIGINYQGEATIDIAKYAAMIKELIADLNVQLIIAPGRSIAGNIGILATEIIYIKETSHKSFAIIDAAMNDLARPGLYGSYHELLPAIKKDGQAQKYDFAGPVCETTDVLGKDRDIVDARPQDLVLFLSAGAYGSSMSNEYNSRPLIPEVLVDGDKFKIIRKRPDFEEMIKYEV